MKRIMLVVAMVMLAGCANRVGTVCIEPTITTAYDTQNPIDIKQETVDFIGNKITPELKNQLASGTKLIYEKDCNKSDFSLYTNIKEVNTGTSSVSWVPGFTNSGRNFEINLNGRLKDNKTQKTVIEFDEFSPNYDMKTSISILANSIMLAIK